MTYVREVTPSNLNNVTLSITGSEVQLKLQKEKWLIFIPHHTTISL